MHIDDRQPELRTASVGDISACDLPRADSVTAVIQQSVRSDAVAAYEQWLKRIIPVAARFPGHRGVHIIKPATSGPNHYTITIRFDTLDHAQDWFRSQAREELLAEAAPFLAEPETVNTVSGLEFWFAAQAGSPPPKRWKQFTVTLAAIFPLTLLVPHAVNPLAAAFKPLQQPLLHHLVATTTVVALMVWVVMPRFTRLVSRWLHA